MSLLWYMLENQSLLADVGVPHEDRGGPRTPPRCMEGFWKKFQMTHFDMPINVTTVKYASKISHRPCWYQGAPWGRGLRGAGKQKWRRNVRGGNSNRNNWSQKTKKALHSYQTDEQQCSMLMVTHHHLAGRIEQIRVLCGPMRSYPNFFSELWIFLTPTNFFVIGPLVSGQQPRRRCIFKH